MEVPMYLKAYELAEILCVSQRTAERRLHALKQRLGIPRWSPIVTDQVVSVMHINPDRVRKYFETHAIYTS